MSPFFTLRQWLLPALLTATLPALAQTFTTFNYTGSPQTYTVPRGITKLQVVATGGGSGNYGTGNGAALAPGAVVQAVVPVTAGEVLTVVVGGQGASGNVGTLAGGYNGGGNGNQTGAGGGATDLRRAYTASTSTGDYLTTRNALVVAGGGGGSDYGNLAGGAGGTPTGGNGTTNGSNPGLGATQAAPGGGGVPGNGPTGGNGATGTAFNGGGGGGYYGGGGAAAPPGGHGAAGGGSSFATATATNVQYSVATAAGNGSLTLTPVTSTTPTSFAYTGGPQYYTVPAGIFRLQVVAQGGAGGSSNVVTQFDSHGGQATGYVTVVPGEVLTVVVGGQGHSYYIVGNNDGGYNGGGSGAYNGGGGGGATDLRRNPAVGSTGDYLTSRNALLVAGGGGGNVTAFYNNGITQPITGGDGGTPFGGQGVYSIHRLEGGGATTTAPGYAYGPGSGGSNGTGGNGEPLLQVGGGGGGYYGGGGGSSTPGTQSNGQGGGGGGSSYVLPTGSSNVSYARVPTIGDGSMTITPVSIANNALDFDGINDRVNVADLQGDTPAGASNLNASGYTLEAWVYIAPEAAAAANSIIRLDGDYGLLVRNGLVETQLWQGSTRYAATATATTPLVAGRWNHVAGTWDGTNLKTYLNGVDVTGLTVSSTPTVTTNTSGSQLRLGRSPSYNEYLTGRLDEVRVYNTALTAAQIQADMFNTTLLVQELTNLQVYFTFDQGTAGGNNTGLTSLADLSGKNNTGTLIQFALTGATSNWVRSFPTIAAISPAAGPAGTVVSIRGTNLTDATGFNFGSLAGAAFATPADDYVASTTVPAGASTGPVSVASAALAAYNGPVFTVTGPLPVQLVAFTAEAQPGAVALAWRTASEINSARFEVERSPDGAAFTAIGTVAAAGSSSGSRAYALADARLPAGASRLYYRLRQVDQDGTFSYSPVRPVVVAGAGLMLYPNPAAGVATLRGAAAGAAVQVLDALGRLVRTAVADAEGTAVLAGLPAGVYAVRCGTATVRLAVE